jgi:hypothetical protein
MIAILFVLGLAVVVGVAASTRNRSGFGWFLLSLVVSPIITGLLVLALPRRQIGDGPIRITQSDCEGLGSFEFPVGKVVFLGFLIGLAVAAKLIFG